MQVQNVGDNVVEIQIRNSGPSGRPLAIVMASPSVSLDKLSGAIKQAVTRNTDLRTKLGLKACPGCAASGFDMDLRHRFDHVMHVDLGQIHG
jgi:hypothetical protein